MATEDLDMLKVSKQFLITVLPFHFLNPYISVGGGWTKESCTSQTSGGLGPPLLPYSFLPKTEFQGEGKRGDETTCRVGRAAYTSLPG